MGNRVWMRLGIEMDLTDAELEELSSGRCLPQKLLELIQSDRCSISGNSYFPETEQNGPLAGYEWDLPKTPMTRFLVETPDGMLVAFQAGDANYPAVEVDIRGNGDNDPDITLSLTEYIPGGEGISDYDPSHPDEMSRQRSEVPTERIQTNRGGNEEVSAGFVTRAWPNEAADQESHHIIGCSTMGIKRTKFIL